MAIDKLFSGESKSIEYKVDVPGKSEKYMKTVVAFANGRGGRIVFGIDDSTLDVTGMNPDTIFQTIDSITNAISDSCEPRIIPDVTLQTVGDKTVIVVEISSGKMRPYYLKSKGIVDGTFIRVAGTTRLAPDFMLKELILEGQNRYYDSEPCDGLCRLPRYLTNPGQRGSKWDMAGSDGISRVPAVFRGKSLLTNKIRIV